MADVLMEHEGVLYRGGGLNRPDEVWSKKAAAFVPYAAAGDKPIDWSDPVSAEEAEALKQ